MSTLLPCDAGTSGTTPAGCDALAVHLVLMNVACSLNVPMGWRMISGTYCVMVPWIMAHWEEYHTGQGPLLDDSGTLRQSWLLMLACRVAAGCLLAVAGFQLAASLCPQAPWCMATGTWA